MRERKSPFSALCEGGCLRMAGFAMVPPAPFEDEVCVAGAWAIPQAQCATVFCSCKPLCLNGV